MSICLYMWTCALSFIVCILLLITVCYLFMIYIWMLDILIPLKNRSKVNRKAEHDTELHSFPGCMCGFTC